MGIPGLSFLQNKEADIADTMFVPNELLWWEK